MKIKSVKFVKGIVGEDEIRHFGVPEIAFIGRSNVGKSSVINSLLNARELARTGSKQGKTRQINYFLINEKYYFVDLPGYGFAEGSLAEREEIREMVIGYFSEEGAGLSKVAIVLDSKVGVTDLDKDMLDILHDNNHEVVFILNKTDKLNQSELSKALKNIKNEFPEIEVLPYSAKLSKGAGFILDRLVA